MQAYVPFLLAERSFRLAEPTLTAISDAEGAIQEAQRHADRVGVSTIAVQLLRSEAIASSQIEGVTTPSHRALAKAMAKSDTSKSLLSAPAAATIANVQAVKQAYHRAATAGRPMDVNDIQDTHRALARADRYLAMIAGEIRATQNWIGRDHYTPVGADFIPPPAAHVRPLLEDLCQYCNRDDLSPLLRAGVAHAQFETIHPFGDGNGRVGRTLIGEMLCRGGLARDVVPPTSLVLSRDRDQYVESLTAWRFAPDGPDRWLLRLAEAAQEAAQASMHLADSVAALQDTWIAQSSHRRADSAAAKLIRALPAYPIITAVDATNIAATSEQAARRALNQLEADGVLRQVTLGRRNRAWESVGLFALVDELERELSGGAIVAAATH